jgi:hypothetical protein
MPRVNQIQLRRDTAANWTSANPTLAAGEVGFETNTGAIKLGDGSAAWTALPYLRATEPATNADAAKTTGYVGMPQVVLNSGNLTLSKAHAGKHIYVTGASQTITIPANASVPFEIGTTIVVVNANLTSSIAITSDTLRLAGTSTTGTRTVIANGIATLIKIEATTWIISGNGVS